MNNIKYYELSDYLQENYSGCGFSLITIEDETTHTNESFAEALTWSEENSQSKPVWNDIKDNFISTKNERNKDMDNLMKRRTEYKAIGINEQLDMMYHDFDNWKATIKAIKDKYPKS